MNILGLSCFMFQHDPAACLVQDGKVIALVEEERFTRIKHCAKLNEIHQFPYQSIDSCLSIGNLKMSDIDYIAINYFPNKVTFKTELTTHLKTGRKTDIRKLTNLYINTQRQATYFENTHKHYLTNKYKFCPKILYIEHHLCHAASAFYPSGFYDATIITLDGSGESNSIVIWKGHDNEIEKIKEYPITSSLGYFYEMFTVYLGFDRLEGTGKVMGLASYGKPDKSISDKMDKILSFKDGNIILDFKIMNIEYISSLFGEPNINTYLPSQYYCNIAYALQHRLEEICIALVEYTETINGKQNLCLAGGVAMNAKMNMMIRKSTKNIFIQPISNDAGTALGAALEASKQIGENPVYKTNNVYLGKGYTNEEIKTILDMAKIKYDYYDDIAGVTSEKLATGNIVGWFQGRMEAGARALGNRSILCNPSTKEMKDTINKYVKQREPWRPFAPSILEEEIQNYVSHGDITPYMIMMDDVLSNRINDIPAVVHIDGTTRPQTVNSKTNPLYHKLIKDFRSETGISALLNTSFNKQEPIIQTPTEALRTFYSSGLDYLAIGNYLVTK